LITIAVDPPQGNPPLPLNVGIPGLFERLSA
jgi:hypothetical protein